VTIGGVRFLLTHGHLHNVKMTLIRLLADARAMGVDAVLFGHTHEAHCVREEDGLWVMNPGSCGNGGGSAGLIETENGQILSCRILTADDLEEFV
jgi:putative phosphoesterase